jgi:hypothetical protein
MTCQDLNVEPLQSNAPNSLLILEVSSLNLGWRTAQHCCSSWFFIVYLAKHWQVWWQGSIFSSCMISCIRTEALLMRSIKFHSHCGANRDTVRWAATPSFTWFFIANHPSIFHWTQFKGRTASLNIPKIKCTLSLKHKNKHLFQFTVFNHRLTFFQWYITSPVIKVSQNK